MRLNWLFHATLAGLLGASMVAAPIAAAQGAPTQPRPGASPALAFVGARLIDGTGAAPIENAVLVVRNGRIEMAGAASTVRIPANAERVDLAGMTVIPGLINAHGHVGSTRGLQSGPEQYTRGNVLDQLGLYARYGVTTVVSLGDDQEEGVRIREEQQRQGADRARLYVAGPVLAPASPEEAVRMVGDVHRMGVNWVKIRVDDQLGQRPKMAPEIYRPLIAEAHRLGLPVAAHIVALEDGKALVRAGAKLLAHSVRDAPVDAELIALMKQHDACLSPTLTRELSTFVYGSRPAFFDDPFFRREADPAVVAQLEQPERQRSTRESAAARYFQQALPRARDNLKALVDAGVRLAFGTDSGPPGRFQGYFEHLELEMMAEAGLTPMQILVSATGDAARCMGLDAELGTLRPGKRADFVVLRDNPLQDIRNARSIQSVWIDGARVPASDR